MMDYFKTKKVIILFNYLWVSMWLSTIILIHVDATTYNDSLKPGDTMNFNSSLYSKNKKFRLFFSQSQDDDDYYHFVLSSSNMYQDVVWSFDRNQPLVDLTSSTILSLNQSGVLKIESQNAKPMIIFSPPQPTNNVVATLLDTGNFVLQQLHPNGRTTMLWQSFDHPYDTLIPGMKLGVNRKTGHNWKLVSRLSNSSSNSGAFSLEWEPKTRELVIKQRNKVFWKSGQLRNETLFQNIPENIQRMYQYVIVSNTHEDSFSFKIKNETQKSLDWKLYSRGKLTSDYGEIANADMCYEFNINNTGYQGCQKWQDVPSCRKDGDVFEEVTFSITCDYSKEYYNMSYGYSDCKSFCWSTCTCIGFLEDFLDGTRCTLFFRNSTRRLENNAARQGGVKRLTLISAMIATATLLIICPLILYLAFKKRKFMLRTAIYESSDVKELKDHLKHHDIEVFNYASVLAATTCFSEINKLGQGGYGPVYKGILTTGEEVAIKRLAKTSEQGIVEFKNELLICELQHINILRLRGCCIHGEEKILIYEYMPNKSLDSYLFDCTRRRFLDWEQRFNIVEGISQGLLYLHKYSRLKIIHRDLNTSNILLDENFKPKISDFGKARLFTQQESTIYTNRSVGTYGYMSPEYVTQGICSTKSDVYGFGILLLEIVSGRKNNSFNDDDHPTNLIGYAWELWKEDRCSQLMDPLLSDTFIPDEVQQCIHVGLLCVEYYADDRPNMSNVISMLTNKNTVVPLPKRPAFYIDRKTNKKSTPFKLSETCSSKDISTFSVLSNVE